MNIVRGLIFVALILGCAPTQTDDPFTQTARQFLQAAVKRDSVTMQSLATEKQVVTFMLLQDSVYLRAAARDIHQTRKAVSGDTALVGFRFRNRGDSELLHFEFRRVSGEWRIKGAMQPNRF